MSVENKVTADKVTADADKVTADADNDPPVPITPLPLVAKTATNRQRLSEEVSRTFATIREMLTDRGLDVSSFDTDPQLVVEEVIEKSQMQVFEVDVHSAKVRVIYNLHAKWKGTEINKFKKAPTRIDDDLKEVVDEDGKNAPSEWQYIIVTRELPSQGKSTTADDHTQLFRMEELLINVSKHSRVPRHTPICDPDKIKQILKLYKLKTPQQLPLILSTDPQARYLNLKPGELVRIERPSPSAGTYVLYRCCHKA